MKIEQMIVTSGGSGMRDALAATEAIGVDAGLERKQLLHLRLLAEELFGILRGIAGDVCARYRLVTDGKRFEMHLKTDVRMTEEMRDRFLAVSSGGENAAAATFTGRLRVLIADMFFAANEAMPYAPDTFLLPAECVDGEFPSVWTMSAYRGEICALAETDKNAGEAWDELEKSIVANVADDVRVGVAGKNVEIVLYKSFN